jgi:hypothetical protein
VGQTSIHDQAPPLPAGADEPTVGAIKRALHELSRSTSGSAQHDGGAILREAHDLLRQLARSNGIDPDAAMQRRRAAARSLREQLVLASATASDRTSD